ncbi:hypothetical protein AB0J38_46110 [Streptomyces sp. NPDC050095]|uniref:allene oxide cyclase barrel-like domain-containing protein n=1 Tax=unclassified Streptomyces TaxID=2593676 RepID=UPI00342663C5
MARTLGRLSSSRRRATAVTFALAAIAATVTGAASTAGASAPAAPAGCQVFTDLAEVTVTMDEHDVAPTGPSVGDLGVYRDEVRDAGGKLVAVVYGSARMLYNRPSDGHLIGLWTEKFEFVNGGKGTAVGVTDIADLMKGTAVVEGFSGTGGRYLGWHGTREWVRTSGDTARTTITLCPDQA